MVLTKEQQRALDKVPVCVDLDGTDGTWEHVVFRVEHPVDVYSDEPGEFYSRKEAVQCQKWLKRYAPDSKLSKIRI